MRMITNQRCVSSRLAGNEETRDVVAWMVSKIQQYYNRWCKQGAEDSCYLVAVKRLRAVEPYPAVQRLGRRLHVREVKANHLWRAGDNALCAQIRRRQCQAFVLDLRSIRWVTHLLVAVGVVIVNVHEALAVAGARRVQREAHIAELIGRDLNLHFLDLDHIRVARM